MLGGGAPWRSAQAQAQVTARGAAEAAAERAAEGAAEEATAAALAAGDDEGAAKLETALAAAEEAAAADLPLALEGLWCPRVPALGVGAAPPRPERCHREGRGARRLREPCPPLPRAHPHRAPEYGTTRARGGFGRRVPVRRRPRPRPSARTRCSTANRSRPTRDWPRCSSTWAVGELVASLLRGDAKAVPSLKLRLAALLGLLLRHATLVRAGFARGALLLALTDAANDRGERCAAGASPRWVSSSSTFPCSKGRRRRRRRWWRRRRPGSKARRRRRPRAMTGQRSGRCRRRRPPRSSTAWRRRRPPSRGTMPPKRSRMCYIDRRATASSLRARFPAALCTSAVLSSLLATATATATANDDARGGRGGRARPSPSSGRGSRRPAVAAVRI